MKSIFKNITILYNELRTIVKSVLEPVSSFVFKTFYIKPINVRYGFVEQLNNYKKFLGYGIIVSIAIHVLVILSVIFFFSRDDAEADNERTKRVINVTLVEIPPPPPLEEKEELIPPIPPSLQKVLPPKKDLKALEPEPVRKEVAREKTIKTQKELDEITTPVSETGDTASYSYEGEFKEEVVEEKVAEKIEEEKKIEAPKKETYSSFEVEKAPEAVNLSQVKNSINYPPAAKEVGIEGRVIVTVLVSTSGRVERVGKITGPDVFHDEVREKVRSLTFTPGLQNGRPVKVWVTVPFVFKLN